MVNLKGVLKARDAQEVAAGAQALSDPGVRTHCAGFGNFHLDFALKCPSWLQECLCLS